MSKEPQSANGGMSNPQNAIGKAAGGGYGIPSNVARMIDGRYGFESDGDFVNWPVIRSMGPDTKDVSDMIDRYTDYFVESESSTVDPFMKYGEMTFDVIPKGTPDGDENLMRESVTINTTTTIGQLLRRLGAREPYRM